MSTNSQTESENPQAKPKAKRAYTKKSHPAAPAEHSEAPKETHVTTPKAKSDGPAKDPAMGDKTPAFVEWFRENHSEAEFEARYGHRKYHQNQQ